MDGNTMIRGQQPENQDSRPTTVRVHVGAATLYAVHRTGSEVVQLWWQDGKTEFGEVRRINGEWTTAVLFAPWRTPSALRQIAETAVRAHGLQGLVARHGR